MDAISEICARAAAAVRANGNRVFSITESNLDDFMAIYAAGEMASAYELANWRRRIRRYFENLTPTVEDGVATLSPNQVKDFLTTVHADDDSFPRTAIGRRVNALEKALPHIAAC